MKPALNGFVMKESSVKLYFEKVEGMPKVEALFVIRGEDCRVFLEQYLNHEDGKNTAKRSYIS